MATKKKQRLTAKRAAKAADTLERDADVLAMLRLPSRPTLDEVAKALGFAGRQGAQQARDRQLGKLAEAALALAKEERDWQLGQTERELAILDAAEAALVPTVVEGLRVDDYARLVLARVRLLTLRAKLTGAMAPTQLVGKDGAPIAFVNVRDLTDEQLNAATADAPAVASGATGARAATPRAGS